MKISKVKVAVFRVVDQYTHEDKFIIASMFPASKPITEVKATFNKYLASHFAHIAEYEESGALTPKMAQAMIDNLQITTPYVLVFNMLDEERSAS